MTMNVLERKRSIYEADDKALFQAVTDLQNGNKQAFNQIYRLSQKYIYSIIYRIVRDNDKTADLMQETYLQIYKKIDTLKNAETFLVWAGRIATTMTLRYIQKTSREVLLEDEEEDFIFEKAGDDKEEFLPEDIMLDKEKKSKIRDIIDNLSYEQKITVQYYYLEDMSVSEIAQIMQCSVGTVKSRLNYARKNIKETVADTEKREGIKLYSLSALPLLLLLFREEAAYAGVPEAVAASVDKGLAEMTGEKIAGPAQTGFKEVARRFFGTTGGIIAAGVAVAVLAGVVAVTQIPKNKGNHDPAADDIKTSLEATEGTDAGKKSEESLADEALIPDNSKTLFASPYSVVTANKYMETEEWLDTKVTVCKNGPCLIDDEYLILINENEEKGVYTIDGKEILPMEFDNIWYNDSTGGLFRVYKDGKTAYYDKTGKMVCSRMYDEVSDVGGGIFEGLDWDTGECDVYFTDGTLISASYEVKEWANGLAVVKNEDNDEGLLSSDGTMIRDFSDAAIYLGDGNYITINEYIKGGTKLTVLDCSGNFIYTEEMANTSDFENVIVEGFYNGLAKLSFMMSEGNGTKHQVNMPVKLDGDIIYSPIGTDYILSQIEIYPNGYFSYPIGKYNGLDSIDLYGYDLFDRNGNKIAHADIFSYYQGDYFVKYKTDENMTLIFDGLIDGEGNPVPVNYDTIKYQYNEDYYICEKNNKYDLYDGDGNVLVSNAAYIENLGCEMFKCVMENETQIFNGQNGSSFTLAPEEDVESIYADGYTVKVTKLTDDAGDDEKNCKYEIIDKEGKAVCKIVTPGSGFSVLKEGIYFYYLDDYCYIKTW